jgi:DNA recombination protein RmuC
MIYFVVGLFVGLVAGLGLGWVMHSARRRAARAEMETVRQQMKDTFDALAGAALDANSKRLTETASTQLEGKKALIDQAVTNINERLNKLGDYITAIEKERKNDLGRLTTSVTDLSRTAGELHQVLASTQRRGAWGERMADDILRLAGLAEGVNYTKQDSTHAAGERERPDFTFFLPNELVVNMDVKFPLENYRAYLDAEGDDARASCAAQLVRDVKNHIKAIASRGYIDAQAGTVPYVLMFLPSEQIFSLVLEAEPDLLDEALGKRIVMTGPMTLYAMLAVIRQAAENINLMRTADEVLDILAEFHKQWDNYNIAVDKVGQRIDQLNKEFQAVTTTRSNVLQRQIDRVEELRSQRGLAGSDAPPEA